MHIHRSPGLTAIYNAAKDCPHNHILDLGSSKTGAFAFFAELSGKIIFECLEEFIADNHALDAEAFEKALQEYCLPKKEGERFDIILVWDLLNYLPFANILKLLNVLSQWCKPDTMLYTIKYSGNTTPNSLPVFDIQDKHHLTVQPFKVCKRHHPAAPVAQFLKHAVDFKIESNISQQTGMLPGFSEQIIRFQPNKASAKQYRAQAEMGFELSTEKHENCLQHFSPALKQLLQFTQNKTASILDLGRRSPENLEYWRQHFDTVYFEDIGSSLQWQHHTENKHAVSPNILRFDDQQRFDIIVTWDLFNFCSADQLSALARHIQMVSHDKTILVAMLYTGSKIPKQPARFWLDKNNVYIERVDQISRERERLTAITLMRYFTGAKMVGTYAYEAQMLGDIREFVFTVDPGSGDTARTTPSRFVETVN